MEGEKQAKRLRTSRVPGALIEEVLLEVQVVFGS
jgi:hypothetical protein